MRKEKKIVEEYHKKGSERTNVKTGYIKPGQKTVVADVEVKKQSKGGIQDQNK